MKLGTVPGTIFRWAGRCRETALKGFNCFDRGFEDILHHETSPS